MVRKSDGVKVTQTASKKKRILHVTFDMAIGGTEQVIRQLVENCDKTRYEVEIVCIDGKVGALGELLSSQGISVFSFSRRPGFDCQLIRELRTYIETHQVDILHTHQYTPYFYGVLASIKTSAKVVFTEHGRFYPDVFKWKRAVVNPFLSLLTRSIVSISKATVEALVRFENFPRRKIQVIYNGIADVFAQYEEEQRVLDDRESEILTRDTLGISSGDIVFGTISRLDPIKNHKMMLQAFRDVLSRHPQCKMLLVGDGPQREETEALIDSLNIRDHIIMTGFKTNPKAYLAHIDIFLLPSLSEGTSMTLLEAMAFSKPCVVTNVGGNPEIVLHEQTGIVIPNEDEAALTQAMVKLVEDAELRRQFGSNGRDRYQEFFSVQSMVEQYQALYDAC